MPSRLFAQSLARAFRRFPRRRGNRRVRRTRRTFRRSRFAGRRRFHRSTGRARSSRNGARRRFGRTPRLTLPRMQLSRALYFMSQRGHTVTHYMRMRTYPDSGTSSNSMMCDLLQFTAPHIYSSTWVNQIPWTHQTGGLGAPTYWNIDPSNELELPQQSRIHVKGIWLTFLCTNTNENQCTVRFCVSQLKPTSHIDQGDLDPNQWWYRNIYQLNTPDFRILRKKSITFNSTTRVNSTAFFRMWIPLNRYLRTFNDDTTNTLSFAIPDNEQLFLNIDSNDQTNVNNYVDIWCRRQILYTQAQ